MKVGVPTLQVALGNSGVYGEIHGSNSCYYTHLTGWMYTYYLASFPGSPWLGTRLLTTTNIADQEISPFNTLVCVTCNEI